METLTCRDVILEFLLDYVEGTLEPATVQQVELHLRLCRACMAYLNTYRKTRDLVGREAAHISMPDEMKVILRRFMLDRMATNNS